ncbi:MAG: methyltransferase domain-containing protein [Pseudonocardiaceae bacterium]
MTLAVGEFSARLVAELDVGGALGTWREAYLAVARHEFIPDHVWVSRDGGQVGDPPVVPVDRVADPQRWLALVYSNTAVLTQFDDGRVRWPGVDVRHSSSSSSEPALMLRMLNALDVHHGHRVLEIGTGTGYNAALLAHRLGAGQVVSIEVDPQVAEQARRALARAGFTPTVVTADGCAGYPVGAPYDRVIATCSALLGQIPYQWVAQTRAGGRLVIPVRTDLTSGPLVSFRVNGDGTATGRVVGLCEFMSLRAQRTPPAPDDVGGDGTDAVETSTDLKPWLAVNEEHVRWAVGSRVSACRWWHTPPGQGRKRHVLWFSDPTSGSWATASYDRDPGPYLVRQHGPRRLWNEIEAAYRWWRHHGEPGFDNWVFTVTPHRQTTELTGEATARGSCWW